MNMEWSISTDCYFGGSVRKYRGTYSVRQKVETTWGLYRLWMNYSETNLSLELSGGDALVIPEQNQKPLVDNF